MTSVSDANWLNHVRKMIDANILNTTQYHVYTWAPCMRQYKTKIEIFVAAPNIANKQSIETPFFYCVKRPLGMGLAGTTLVRILCHTLKNLCLTQLWPHLSLLLTHPLGTAGKVPRSALLHRPGLSSLFQLWPQPRALVGLWGADKHMGAFS